MLLFRRPSVRRPQAPEPPFPPHLSSATSPPPQSPNLIPETLPLNPPKTNPKQTQSKGAWCGYGFHEDGIKAGVEAATLLGASVPWEPVATSPKVSWSEGLFLGIFDK